jgi:subtilisin family serine protease
MATMDSSDQEKSSVEQEKIRRDLVRTVIKEPLYAEIAASKSATDEVSIIIEVNDGYYQGKTEAATWLDRLVKQAAESVGRSVSNLVTSIGSEQNPYFKIRLPPSVILALVETDYGRAQDERAAALAKEQATDSSTPKPTRAPVELVRYLVIRRIWLDHPLRALIDRSVSTVKADAARRAFLAEGRDIVWAVIDSGIDGKHTHFQGLDTLDVTLPVCHCDFTIPKGDGSPTALVDNFGHGTHVAGIIAGGFEVGGGTGVAYRTRLGPNQQVETFKEDIKAISGMAPSCKLVSMKVLDDRGQGEVSNIIAAIDRIQAINDFGRNLKIHGVNLSVGYEFDPSWFACGQTPVCVEVDRLARSGVVVVIAAGNTGYGLLTANQRPTGAGMMLTINDPGNAELPITVGSTHRDAPHMYGVSYFSSKGPTGDGRMKPDVVAPGERVLSCCTRAKAEGNAENAYVEDSGTSMAAPHVSGVIAAFLSIRREYIGRHEDVKRLFLSTATDLSRNPYFQGRGLIDLMRAIQSI